MVHVPVQDPEVHPVAPLQVGADPGHPPLHPAAFPGNLHLRLPGTERLGEDGVGRGLRGDGFKRMENSVRGTQWVKKGLFWGLGSSWGKIWSGWRVSRDENGAGTGLDHQEKLTEMEKGFIPEKSGIRGDLLALHNSLKVWSQVGFGICSQRTTGQEGTPSSCSKGILRWILRKIPHGKGCPALEQWWRSHPWNYSKNIRL